MRDLVIDVWSALSHKAPMRDDVEARVNGWTPKSWLGEEHRRRLTAYTILAAYDHNTSRVFLSGDEQDREERREYGDAALIVDTVQSAVLGDSQEIVVAGAEDYDPDLPDAPEEGDDAEEHAEAVRANEAARVLADRQEFLREWADAEHLELRLTDGERDAVRSGDAAYLFGWSDAKRRPTVAVMDPGFYFPVLPDSLDGYEFPERVHFAWEIPAEQFTDGKIRVRRLTYELAPLRPLWDVDDPDADPVLPEGARWETGPDGEARLVRDYPWGSEPSDMTCLLTDATWILDDLNDASDVDAFDLSRAMIRAAEDGEPLVEYDLGIDFVPVVHVPNTPAGGHHYGQSSLARVLQLLDDLQNADTDAQAAAALTGSPIIGISGTKTQGDDPLTGRRGERLEVRPGAAWKLGENGGLSTIDTSANLAATREYVQALRDRLAVNSRLPAAVLGTVKPSEAPSGYAMQLSFGPLNSMIRQMRLVRAVKHPLMLKMVQRLYQAAEVLPPGETPRAEIALGSYLPSDMQGTLDMVVKAYEKGIASLETAVTMLLEAGFSVDDVAEEVARIEGRDFEGANRLADATGDQNEVRKYLGREEVRDAEGVPQVTLPVAGGSGVGVPNPTDRDQRQ